jgi:hypothetical protein
MTIESNNTVPNFNVTADSLLGVVDWATHHATQVLNRAQQAFGHLPPEAQPAFAELMTGLRIVGFTVDATVAGTGAGLAEVWGITGTAAAQ